MFCPKCNSEKTSVTDSRGDGGAIRRRRECQECGYRFTTYERVELALPAIIKKDGSRANFDREKIRGGLRRACEKRPVSTEIIDAAVEAIERKVTELCQNEVDSRTIGELVMEELRKIDKVAYIRFASVYREFSDISQFVDELKSLGGTNANGGVSSKPTPRVVGNS
jgi:transcriptional repressor NrdR